MLSFSQVLEENSDGRGKSVRTALSVNPGWKMWRPKFQQSDVRVFYIENADEKRHTIVQCLNHHFSTNFRSTLKALPLQEQQRPLNTWLPFWYTSFRPFILFYFLWALQVFENFAVTNVR